jgi:hypothetical protein
MATGRICHVPPSILPVAILFNYGVNQKIGHMVQVVYGNPKIPIEVKVKQLCVHGCRTEFDSATGHTLGFWCKRPTVDSGLRECDICYRQYINKTKHQNPRYETICPDCERDYGI